MRSVVSAPKKIADQSPRDGEVHVLPVQGNVYMLVADGTNITASVGPEGIALVNTGAAAMSEKVLAKVSELAQMVVSQATTNRCVGATCPGIWGWSSPYINNVISSPAATRPIRYIVNTSAAPEHVGGNEKIAAAGTGMRGGGLGGAIATVEGAPIVAHENVLNRMSAPAGKQSPSPQKTWPTVSYFDEFYKFPAFFNGEGVVVYHTPAANTDGDSIVAFRHSEVISAGDLFSTVSYPPIDIEKGGSVDGVIARPEQDPGSGLRRIPVAGRDVDHPEPWPAVGHGRRRVLSQHGGHDSRSGAGSRRQRHDARTGEGREAVGGLRRALRCFQGCPDRGLVRRSGLSQFTGEKVMGRMLLLVAAVSLVASTGAVAHHSYSATYDTSRTITLEGKLVQFVFKNPHSFVTVQAPDDKGAVRRWSLEWAGTAQLARSGVERESLKPGDEVTIVGNPSRVTGEFKALMVSLKRPLDGFAWGGRGRSRSTRSPLRLVGVGMRVARHRGGGVPACGACLAAGSGGRGARPPPTPQASQAVDLTGYWVSVIVEDWKWRMVTPKKGVFEGVPLNAAGRKVGESWDPARDEAAGEQCRAYGAANFMRLPGRLHITWQDANTLKVERDSGTQTRLFQFGAGAAERTTKLAGALGRLVGPTARARPGRQGIRRKLEGGDDQLAPGLRAQERRATQRASGGDGVLRHQHASEWRSMDDRHDQGRGSRVFRPPLPDDVRLPQAPQ